MLYLADRDLLNEREQEYTLVVWDRDGDAEAIVMLMRQHVSRLVRLVAFMIYLCDTVDVRRLDTP